MCRLHDKRLSAQIWRYMTSTVTDNCDCWLCRLIFEVPYILQLIEVFNPNCRSLPCGSACSVILSACQSKHVCSKQNCTLDVSVVSHPICKQCVR